MTDTVDAAAALGRELVLALSGDLQALLDLPPADRVRLLGAWLDNSGSDASVRTRLGAVRRLSALEVMEGVSPPAASQMRAVLGTEASNAYKLAAEGRALLNRRAGFGNAV